MKKLFFVLFAFCAGIGFADAQSTLKVRLADNSPFNISVNGRYFNRQGTSITLGDLPPGRQHIKIHTIVHDRWGRGYDRVIYQGTVNTEYRMATHFVYDPYTRRITIKETPTDGGYVSAPDEGNNDDRYRSDDRGNNNDDQGRRSNDDAVASNKNSSMPAASPVPMGSFTDERSDKLKTKVDAKKTDTEKLALIKDELRKETLTTIQVGVMMDWFLFESTKVEFLKWAYNNTTDKDFYSDLAAKLNYKSSKDELSQFLKDRK